MRRAASAAASAALLKCGEKRETAPSHRGRARSFEQPDEARKRVP